MEAQGSKLGLLAFVAVFAAIAALLVWKVSSSSEDAGAVADRVVDPYLAAVKRGDHAEALSSFAAAGYRERVTADALAASYEELVDAHGAWTSWERVRAQAQHVIGGETTVRCDYRLVFEESEVHITFDVQGEGEEARIVEAYDRRSGRGMLERAVH